MGTGRNNTLTALSNEILTTSFFLLAVNRPSYTLVVSDGLTHTCVSSPSLWEASRTFMLSRTGYTCRTPGYTAHVDHDVNGAPCSCPTWQPYRHLLLYSLLMEPLLKLREKKPVSLTPGYYSQHLKIKELHF